MNKGAPMVPAREISVVGSFDNPGKKEADEVDAMSHDRWEPTSDDVRAVAGHSARQVVYWKGLMQVLLTHGDAESAGGSISRVQVVSHANSDATALSGA